MKPRSPTLPADSLPAEPPGKPIETDSCIYVSKVCDYNLSKYEINREYKTGVEDSPGGPGVKNPAATAGDTADPCSGKIPYAAGPLSPGVRLLSPSHRAHKL